jgi:hypothetical protein
LLGSTISTGPSAPAGNDPDGSGRGTHESREGGAQASADPTASAVEWLIAYRSVSYLDPSAGSWVPRISGFATPRLNAEYRAIQDGGGGEEWASFVRQRCVAVVTDTNAVVPAEAPSAASSVFVQVSGEVDTHCAAGMPPGGEPAEKVAMTVAMSRGADRLWRVDRRVS